MRQFLRVYACLLALTLGGGGGALLVDGTLGERERARVRAAHPGEPVCGGPGIDVFLAGGFALGAVPAAWALARLGAVRWVLGRDEAQATEPDAPATGRDSGSA